MPADNRPMLQVFRAPPELRQWVDGAVRIELPAGAAPSRFPATPHAMLTWRRPAGGCAGAGPITFHTLSTAPTVHPHDVPTVAMGLLVRPAAAACLLGASTGVLVNQVQPWGVVAGTEEAARAEEALHLAANDGARLQLLMASLARTLHRVPQGREPAIAHRHTIGGIGCSETRSAACASRRCCRGQGPCGTCRGRRRTSSSSACGCAGSCSGASSP